MRSTTPRLTPSARVHTNGIANLWPLLKRSLKGTCVAVKPFHLFRYLDEQAFRYNNRKTDDGHRFIRALARAEGKRDVRNADNETSSQRR